MFQQWHNHNCSCNYSDVVPCSVNGNAVDVRQHPLTNDALGCIADDPGCLDRSTARLATAWLPFDALAGLVERVRPGRQDEPDRSDRA